MKPCLFTFFLILLIQFTFSQTKPFDKASWITTNYEEASIRRACPIFNKEFKLKEKLRSAKLYVTALGLYEAKLNGKKIGSDYFTPGFTNYNKRLQYQVYDITKDLQSKNELQVIIGEGWYRGVFWGPKHKDIYGSQAGLLVQLELLYQDGTQETIVSDPSWNCKESNILYSEIYDGECIDLTKKDQNWASAKSLNYTKEILVPTETAPVKQHENFKPQQILTTPKGEQVIDFGQNIAGWVKLKIKGQKGDTIRLYHGEALDEKGNFYNGNLRGAKATDIYILKGNEEETLEPHFTYHGFRYVKVTGFKATKDNITAIALYSNLQQTGTFSCSNPKLNQLQSNILWSMKSNFFDIPTDCPQRTERLGWTEDADVFCTTASYLMNVKSFYSKWLADLASEQQKDGGVPVTIPYMYSGNIQKNAAGWSDAATLTPWRIYERYGDLETLKRQYASMKAWVDYMAKASPGYLWKANGFGDWYPAGPSTDLNYLNQCYFYKSTITLVQTAGNLQKFEDVDKYMALAKNIKAAFDQTYKDVPKTQTAYVIGLEFGLLPPSAIDQLVKLVEQNGTKLSTGFMGTPYLLHVLSRYGHTDLAYKLLLQQDTPSWLYMVNKGATTIWEKWDAIREDRTIQTVSLNQYAFGSVGIWMYEHIGGIRPINPGYKKIRIKPEIGGGLTWAKSSYICAYGKIVSNWELKNGEIHMTVEIPKGTTAEICIPGKSPFTVKPGKYHFKNQL